jgi:hypothetical protein
MKTEMIDWKKNLNFYTDRDLCKQAGNSEGGLAYRMLDLGGWILRILYKRGNHTGNREGGMHGWLLKLGGWIADYYNILEIHNEIRGIANPSYRLAEKNP